jgi:hypothetical protein
MRILYKLSGHDRHLDVPRAMYVWAASPLAAQAHGERKGLVRSTIESVDPGSVPEGETIETAGRSTLNPPLFSLEHTPVRTIAVGVALGIVLGWVGIWALAAVLGVGVWMLD